MPQEIERLTQLYSSLSAEQQEDVLNLLETWVKMQKTIADRSMQKPQAKAAEKTSAYRPPSLEDQWECINTLRDMVRHQFRPTVELAYIAFHPDLDSISSAKSRQAVEKMFELEAAYELKSILETQHDSTIITNDMIEDFRKKSLS